MRYLRRIEGITRKWNIYIGWYRKDNLDSWDTYMEWKKKEEYEEF